MQFFLLTTLFVSAAVAMPNLLSTRNDDACVGKVNGVLVATNTCNSFVTCFNGAGTVHNCEQGKLFNETIGQCDWAMNVNCEEHVGTPQGPAPNCHGRYGQMLRNPYDCSSFYRCEHNAALLFHCDEGLYFDTTINNCNWKQNVVCRIDDMPVDEGAPVRRGRNGEFKEVALTFVFVLSPGLFRQGLELLPQLPELWNLLPL